MKTLKNISIMLCLLFPITIFAQQDSLPPNKRYPTSGMFSCGVRTTLSLFSHGKLDEIGYGGGAQMRLQLHDRINTEWYMDVLSTDIDKKAGRLDYHIGWSVFFYYIHPRGFTRPVTPFIEAGHCFDYTVISPNGRNKESVGNFSSAVQLGTGTHFNITPKFDITVKCQYMFHLGSELHAHALDNGELLIEKHKNAGWQGHLLLTISANYKIARLWKSKKSKK
ncbi:MAG: hypothetical protein H3C71_00550 [Flavobacteriales bacterium]|nr:hypothetical protein [Flavobacteriales bacterium]